ncbi:hypothetical protein [Methanosphaerula palustris]|uniref:hypothetical protein n=1 Tax=Methanosphaerula palustris TaxID=475088 RepID=UPI00032329E6|nr:hypothetical protein [Methanosphaerula palustris]
MAEEREPQGKKQRASQELARSREEVQPRADGREGDCHQPVLNRTRNVRFPDFFEE